MSLPRYGEYKDSGDHWLGCVPEKWQLVRVKHALDQMGSGGTPDTSNPLLWTEEGGTSWVAIGDMSDRDLVDVTAKSLSAKGVESKDLTVWPPGTLLFSMYASLGHVAELSIPATTNQAILALLPNKKFYQGFLKRWFECIRPNLRQAASSNTQDNLNAEKVRNLPILMPSLAEQVAISTFLDRETAKIDALIAEQEKLLALLAEKRQATISHAVTRGLNPDAPLKDSGIPWLGQVPEHWEVRRLKHAVPAVTVGIVVEPSKHYVDEGVPALRSLNVSPGQIRTENMVFISDESNDLLGKSKLRTGDVVVVRSGQAGAAAVVPSELDGCNCIDLIIIRKPLVGCERFLCWYLASDAAIYQFEGGSEGAIQKHFNIGTAMNLALPWPKAEEQTRVADYLDAKVSEIDGLADRASHAIGLLKERRGALIAAAVTGQIDVRELAK